MANVLLFRLEQIFLAFQFLETPVRRFKMLAHCRPGFFRALFLDGLHDALVVEMSFLQDGRVVFDEKTDILPQRTPD